MVGVLSRRAPRYALPSHCGTRADPKAGAAYPLQPLDRTHLFLGVLQVEPQIALTVVLNLSDVVDEATRFQNSRDLLLHLRARDIHLSVPSHRRIPYAGEHVCDRVGHHSGLSLWPTNWPS